MASLTFSSDPTLAAMDEALVASSVPDPRPYLGASSIGNPCDRALWYSFRHATTRTIPAAGMRRINDGHRGEQVLIAMLRTVPGIQLWTEDPEQPGQQIGFTALSGHFRGNLDGIIQGILQAPKTPHVWEAKVCNEAKVRKLDKLKLEKGEKAALELWDETYFAQAQIYMHYLGLTRHYLTVATPGVRDIVSCRTDYQPKVAQRYISRAKEIITAERPPLKLRDDPAYFVCKFCDHHALCHGTAIPEVNCRTCAHSTARLDDAQPWTCELSRPEINAQKQPGCPHHAFHPDLLNNHAEAIGADVKNGVITFRMKAEPGLEFKNGIGCVSSLSMRDKDRAAKDTKAPIEIPIEDDVRASLAMEMTVEYSDLAAGKLDESDWERMPNAVKRLSGIWEGDDRRSQALRAVIEQADAAFMALAGGVTLNATS
jgi:hypothetical protein